MTAAEYLDGVTLGEMSYFYSFNRLSSASPWIAYHKASSFFDNCRHYPNVLFNTSASTTIFQAS